MTTVTINSGDATATPSAAIIARSNKSATVTDARGRAITVKKLSALDKMRLFTIAGPELSLNEAWISMAALAFSVTQIGTEPNIKPNARRELDFLVDVLDDEGLEAAAKAYAAIGAPKDDVIDSAKN